MRITTILLSSLLAGSAWGQVPASLNYQGYLTDRDGVPEQGSTLVTFSIYAVEVSGSPLWNDTLNIDVDNGLFSIQLGRPANPFPSGLFETPLWMGIAVEADGEMIPRRALTSVGFSFRSEDSNSVQGKSAFELDQSGHVADMSNPHLVTAVQVGAVDQSMLNAHTGDTGNPHGTTAVQTGATDAAAFSLHADDEAAHHARYADTEAIAALGPQGPDNPLNHDRYTDTETVAAVLAADGSGSGLDADTVDGIDGTSLLSSGGISVTANGVAIGRFVPPSGWESGFSTVRWLPVISSTGRLFFVDSNLASEGELRSHDVLFSGQNCTGDRYLDVSDAASRVAMRNGYVFQAYLSEVFQVERDSAGPIVVVPESVIRSSGGCVSTSGSTNVYVIQPNDPATTGVSSASFASPIRIQ